MRFLSAHVVTARSAAIAAAAGGSGSGQPGEHRRAAKAGAGRSLVFTQRLALQLLLVEKLEQRDGLVGRHGAAVVGNPGGSGGGGISRARVRACLLRLG
jgi:hypothetical protein